jgi:glyoxylase-like metal-dependent hydrolase (beta-lactamase superfamily II)
MPDAKVREVLRGIFVAHLPLPMRPTIVNVTVLHSRDEWALVDTGVNTPDSIATFKGVLAQIGCRPEQISKIICTHHHPDHFGTSKTFKELTGADVYLNRLEYEASTHYAPSKRGEEAVHFFLQHGIPLQRFVKVPSPGEFWAQLYAPVVPDHFIDDGDKIRVGDFEIDVISTPGHTPGHCVMYLRHQRVMIVGDHLLPKITPHVGVFPGGPTNPLADFLNSQRKVQGFDVNLVLPAHGGTYHDHRHRANQIIQHHQYRMQEMLDIVRARPRTAYEVASQAFAFGIEAPLTIQFPATFETLAHLEYLRAIGKAAREEQGERMVYRAAGRN